MNFNSRFFWRMYLNYAVVVLTATLVLGVLLISQVTRHEYGEVYNTLEEQAQTAGMLALPSLITLNYPELTENISRLGEATGTRFTIVDQRGVVLADSHANPYRLDNHLRRPEILDAVREGNGTASRFSQTMQEEFIYHATLLERRGETMGYARAGLSMADVRGEIRATQNRLLLFTCLVAFAALLVACFQALRLAAPLGRITDLAGRVAKGDFDRRLPEVNSGGLGKLSQAINELARNSARRVAEVTADRNRLAATLAGMVEGVIGVDPSHKIIHLNDSAASLLGISTAGSLNKPFWEVVRVREIMRALDQATNSGEVVKTQMRLSRRSDELVVDIHVAALHSSQGEPMGAVIVLNDITELVNLERIRTDFVANASHELKTPITAIRGLAETLQGDEDPDPEMTRRFIDRIHAQSLRLSRLINDLMAISRLESEEQELTFVPVDMVRLVNGSVQSAEPTREEKGHELILELPDEPLQVSGDWESLNQLVDNLVDNAIKYTPENGRIRVALRREDEDVVLIVEDNGIGISPQYQQRVFERFYRVDKARSQSLGGTGLGLSIVKNIAEKHGGSVTLESRVGAGSRFIVRLPVSSGDQGQP